MHNERNACACSAVAPKFVGRGDNKTARTDSWRLTNGGTGPSCHEGFHTLACDCEYGSATMSSLPERDFMAPESNVNLRGCGVDRLRVNIKFGLRRLSAWKIHSEMSRFRCFAGSS